MWEYVLKGQIQLMESTFVLFAFFFILAIGLVVYGNFQEAKLEAIEIQFEQQRAIQIAQKILALPEIQCSNNAVSKLNCYDIQKLIHFQNEAKTLFYRKEFPGTLVNISLAYAPSLSAGKPEFFKSSNTNTLFDFSAGKEDKDTFYFPISLWDKRFVPEKSYFGWVIIEVYS